MVSTGTLNYEQRVEFSGISIKFLRFFKFKCRSRFKFSYGLATLATVVPAAALSVALFTLVRVPTSPLVLMGIAGGILGGFWGIVISLPVTIILISTYKFFKGDIDKKVDTISKKRTVNQNESIIIYRK